MLFHFNDANSSTQKNGITPTTTIEPGTADEKTIRENIDFILLHFQNQHELFPRTIMTFKNGYQQKIEYEVDGFKLRQLIFDCFKQSDFLDCRISAFPFH